MKWLRKGGRERRTAPRRPAGWHGTYTLPRYATLRSGECRVLDVSTSGVGLELYGPGVGAGIDEELLVCLDPSQDGGGRYELQGRVRNLARTKFGFVRVGVEFVDLSPEAHAYLCALTQPRRVKAQV